MPVSLLMNESPIWPARFSTQRHRVHRGERSPDLAQNEKNEACRLIQRGAEFEHALARPFHGKSRANRGVQQQNYAVEFPFAGTPGERQTNRMKQPAPAEEDAVLERSDDLFEAVGI